MPGGATTPQGRTFIGIDPTQQSRFHGWAFDARRRETRAERAQFAAGRRAERAYGVRLRRLAQMIDELVRGLLDPEDPNSAAAIENALSQYARILEPWAEALANSMLIDVARRDEAAWSRHGQKIGRLLRQEIESAPIGPAFQQLQAEQVHLITSLPREAAERVHWLTGEAIVGGQRWEDISEDILATGEVTRSRANLIARTETGRATTNFTRVRAEHIGSEGYVWRTAGDADVRPQHKRLEGTFHRWDDPPIASEPGQREMRYHPGAGPNCRCYPEVVLPEEEIVTYKEAPQSLTYLEAANPNHPAVERARARDPKLAERLAAARIEVDQLQALIHLSAKEGDDEAVERLDGRLAAARRRYDDLGARFDRLR